MAGGKKPNGKSGAEDENKDVAKAAGFVVFSGIALSIIKALCPKKSIEEFVQSEDTVPSTSSGDTAGEPKEDAKVTPLSAQNIIEKTSEVQKQVNGLKTSEVQKHVNGLKTSEVQKQEDAKEKTSEVQKQVNALKTSEVQKNVNGLKTSEVQKQEKNSEVQNKVIGFGSGISKKFQKQGSTKKSGTTIELVRGDTLWHLSQKYGVSIDSIKAANGLTDDMIYAGDKLIIPS